MKSPSLDNTIIMRNHLLILNRNNMRRLILHQGIGDLLNQMQHKELLILMKLLNMGCHLQILKVHLRNKKQDMELLIQMKLLDMRLLHTHMATKLLILHQGMRRLHLHLGARNRLIPNNMKQMHHHKLIKIHHLNNVKAMETPTMSQAMMMAIHIKDMVQEAFGTAEMKKKPLAS